MCEYCGCQAVSAIALLTREHDLALDHIRAVAHADDDRQLRSSCFRLRALLGPHTAVEEQALFPPLRDDFPDQIAALLREHDAIDEALAEATSSAPRGDGWQQRLDAALDLLREHILKEQDGVFPAALSTLSPAQWDQLEQVRAHTTSAQDLDSRAVIDELLVSFYRGAMTDDLLGPVFAVAQLDLHTHLPRIGDFWERTLLGTGDYTGQPMVVHRRLHQTTPLTPAMFDRWLELWSAAVELAYTGPLAESAKDTARRVAGALQRQLSEQGPALLQIGSPRAERGRT